MADASASVILIEFNELTPRLMDRFMSDGLLPNFKRFRSEAQVYTTDAEEEGENLNPWVQWVTVHNGLSAAEHGITRLSDGHKLRTKAVWDVLSEAGLRVWVCGSMNARYDQPLKGCLLPDPWSTGLTPYPVGEFDAFTRFVRFSVQEHTDQNAKPSKFEAFKFLAYMAGHGLSLGTVAAVLKQLWTEKTTGKFRWKRAALLDQLQWDVFRSYYRRLRPHFSTFFLNSTAHFQHAYWRNLEPESFKMKPSEEDQAEHKDAVLFGYRKMDEMIGRFMSLAGPRTTIVFCTALSQQPYTRYEDSGGRHYYRIKSPDLLRERLRLDGDFSYHPVMAEQFCLRFATPSEAARAQEWLGRYRVQNSAAFHCDLQEHDLMVQCNQTGTLPEDVLITTVDSDQKLPFFDIFYETGDVKSGFHHPDGMLWVRRPDHRHRVHRDKVSLRSIAPAVLEMFDVPCPDFMTCPSFTRPLVAVS